MQHTKLVEQLQADAAQDVPPFAADSVKLAHQMGKAAVSSLREQVTARGTTSFLALEALREADIEAYQLLPARLRAEVYGEALRNVRSYNAWGVPGYQLTATANAFITLGDEAITVLEPLLDDKRPAQLSGSQSATTSEMYGNRVCDYAWVFINEIRQQHYAYSMNPSERDAAIDALRRSLKHLLRPCEQPQA